MDIFQLEQKRRNGDRRHLFSTTFHLIWCSTVSYSPTHVPHAWIAVAYLLRLCTVLCQANAQAS